MKQIPALLTTVLLMVSACNNLEEANYQAADSLTQFKNDTGGAWRDLFRYNPKPRTPQQASTRYCYQFSGDVVCYDNPQPQVTSRLVGVQGAEGQRMIVYQSADTPVYGMGEPAPLFPQPAGPIPSASGAAASSGGDIVQSKDLPAPAAPAAPFASSTAEKKTP